MSALPAMTPSMTFDQAAQAVLDYLRTSVPMGFWSVTRVENGRQTYLYLDEDNSYGLHKGGSHPWEASYCIHMVAGRAPHVAPEAQSVPLYRDAPVSKAIEIGAYAGMPITEPDGTLFGAICGLDPEPRDDAFLAVEPLLALLSSLLNIVLAAERARDDATRRASEAFLQAETDLLTGLFNRRGWERLIGEEQERFRRMADPTVVVMIDLDRLKVVNDTLGHEAGDAYIRAAGAALREAVRDSDPVARLGGDEFGILLPRCTEEMAARRVAGLYDALGRADVAGSLGWAPITVLTGLPGALAAADQAMYAAKRERRAARAEQPAGA